MSIEVMVRQMTAGFGQTCLICFNNVFVFIIYSPRISSDSIMISIRRSPTSHPAGKQNAKREASSLTDNRCFRPRACLKNHFRNL